MDWQVLFDTPTGSKPNHNSVLVEEETLFVSMPVCWVVFPLPSPATPCAVRSPTLVTNDDVIVNVICKMRSSLSLLSTGRRASQVTRKLSLYE